MNYSAIIPVKSLDSAKSRLAKTLPSDLRQKLVLMMLQHVIETLTESKFFDTVFVVSSDQTVLDFSKKYTAIPLQVPLHTLNSDLQKAALMATKNNPDRLLTISADLPWVTIPDIHKLVALQKKSEEVVLVPSKEQTGTNAVLCTPLALPFLFGKNSLSKFQKAATERNVSTAMYHSPTIAFDLDTPTDLKTLLAKDNVYSFLL